MADQSPTLIDMSMSPFLSAEKNLINFQFHLSVQLHSERRLCVTRKQNKLQTYGMKMKKYSQQLIPTCDFWRAVWYKFYYKVYNNQVKWNILTSFRSRERIFHTFQCYHPRFRIRNEMNTTKLLRERRVKRTTKMLGKVIIYTTYVTRVFYICYLNHFDEKLNFYKKNNDVNNATQPRFSPSNSGVVWRSITRD